MSLPLSSIASARSKKYSVALVTDYFYPNTGGIETHVRTIGEELCKMGHSVIIITHKYKNYTGKMIIGKLLVYYLDLPIIACNTTMPTLFSSYLLYHEIFTKHRIDIVHGHQTMSTMCMEAIYHASHLGIRTVLTDHSVFEFGKFERVICDALAFLICRSLDRAICVSNIARINTSARINMPLDSIKVIPNGIDPRYFYPKKKSTTKKIKVLFCARLVFRKGIDLLVAALPIICKNKDVEIIIVGDGPKRDDVMQMIDEAELHDQVKIIGEMDYKEIPNIMRESDIFLNTSLTETFCTSILEAASCGLLVVSTNVGGIHEVLDDGIIYFCKPTPEDIADQIRSAIRDLASYSPSSNYQRFLDKYDWRMIAERTLEVYDEISPKQVGMRDILHRFEGINNLLCRFFTWIEYSQKRIFFWLGVTNTRSD